MEMPEKSERGAWIANKTFLSIWGAFFSILIIILAVVINVATQMEDIEEKLKYIPPQTKADAIPTESVVTGQWFMCQHILISIRKVANHSC